MPKLQWRKTLRGKVGEVLTHLLPRLNLPRRALLTTAAVAAAAGLMFSASARLADDPEGLRQSTGLVDMVRTETDSVDALADRADKLRAEVESLTDTGLAGSPKEDSELVRLESARVGTKPVSGPGILVELDDAPPASATIPGANVDDLVVHQQDLEHVINAMWAGGAEAMMLQGQRVTMTSAVRCTGNVLLLHGQVFSPPFVVEAIGDPEALLAALEASPGVTRYRQNATVFGLGWHVSLHDQIEMPAYAGSADLRFAALPEGIDPLR